jgi:cyanuric acid amidohydrolase
MAIEVRKVILEGVSDASGLATLIDDGVFAADEIIGVIGKTEGNGGVNDFTRILADQAFRKVLMDKGTRPADEVKQIPMVWSGGVDGVLCPHATVFAEVEAEPSDELRLTVGIAMSDPILPEEIGRVAMVEKVAEGVRRAMAEAGIEDPADVHYVQTKTPLWTSPTALRASELRSHSERSKCRPMIRSATISAFSLRSPLVRLVSNSIKHKPSSSAMPEGSAATTG